MSKFADRVMESTTSVGTGDLALDGAFIGAQRFADVCEVGDQAEYLVFAANAVGNSLGAWEQGIGTYSALNTLTRTTVLASSNGGAAVDFASGTKRVMLSPGARWHRAADSFASTSIRRYGAQGNSTIDATGGSDDTQAFLDMCEEVTANGGGVVVVDDGFFRIDGSQLVIPSNFRLIMSPNAYLVTNRLGGGGANAGEDVANGSMLVSSHPSNASNHASFLIEGGNIRCADPDNVGAAFYDNTGSYFGFSRVKFDGFLYGAVLDQSELVRFTNGCEFNGQNDGGAGLWIVNGATLTPGNSPSSTNRITVDGVCQFNQGGDTYGILDNGGTSHNYGDNNYNGCLNHIRAAGVTSLLIRSGEYESATGACVLLSAKTLDGTGVGGCVAAVYGGSFNATPGNHSIMAADDSNPGTLAIDGNPAFSGDHVTTVIGNASHFAAIIATSYSLNDMTFKDGVAGYVDVDLVAMTINGVSFGVANGSGIGGGHITAPNGITSVGELTLENGAGSTAADATIAQELFGFGGTDQYRHAIVTRHNTTLAGNAIDIYLHKGGVDGPDDVPTLLAFTLDASGGLTLPGNISAANLGTAAAAALSIDGTMAANSDTAVPSQKAVRTYVATIVAGTLKFQGSTDCSGNPNYPAASKGDVYVVSVAGKIGGAAGTTVEIGDEYFAIADNAGGTQASVGASWDVLERNDTLATVATTGSASDLVAGTLPAGRFPALTGDVTTVAGALAATIAAKAVTLAKMADVATATVFYRKTAGTGPPEVNTLATLKADLAIAAGDVSGLAAIATSGSGADLGANTVALGKLATQAAATILGNNGGGAAAPAALTVAQVKTLLAIATGDVTPSVQSVASAATVTPAFSDAQTNITAQAAGLTLANWSGTAVPARRHIIRIKDNGSPQTIAYGTKYRAINVTLPTTTAANKTLYLGCVYNSTDDKFDVLAVGPEA